MKTNHFNRIRKALNHPENAEAHLEGLRNMVQNFQDNFGICNLSNVLWIKYFNTYAKIML
jgi:hypothetical protein